MTHPRKRLSVGLGIVVLAAAVAAATVLALATGGNAASSKSCTQLSTTQANCLFVSVVPTVVSTNQAGLVVSRFKNTFATANTSHTILTVTLPTSASASSVSTSASASCSAPPFTQVVSCSFGSVPGGAIVSMYVQFTTSLAAGATLPAVQGAVSFDESNGNTGTTTNDTFTTFSSSTPVVAPITSGQGGDQGGLCTNNLAQTGFTTSLNGQQTIVSNLPAPAQGGLPCTPVSGGVRTPTADESSACGGSCAFATSWVFFPVLANNATATVILDYPTIPSTVTAWQKTPLFEFLPGKNGATTLVQLVRCGVTPNPSPDSCIAKDPTKFGSKGIEFTLSVAGSLIDGRYLP